MTKPTPVLLTWVGSFYPLPLIPYPFPPHQTTYPLKIWVVVFFVYIQKHPPPPTFPSIPLFHSFPFPFFHPFFLTNSFDFSITSINVNNKIMGFQKWKISVLFVSTILKAVKIVGASDCMNISVLRAGNLCLLREAASGQGLAGLPLSLLCVNTKKLFLSVLNPCMLWKIFKKSWACRLNRWLSNSLSLRLSGRRLNVL